LQKDAGRAARFLLESAHRSIKRSFSGGITQPPHPSATAFPRACSASARLLVAREGCEDRSVALPAEGWEPLQRRDSYAPLCAYRVEWHLRQRLAPMLYDDAEKATAEALRNSVVAKAQRSPSAIAKQTHGTTPDGLPVHSLQTLLADLATLAQNTVVAALSPAHEFVVHTRPTELQQKALALLGINPATCTQ